jgi:hypothetical protein
MQGDYYYPAARARRRARAPLVVLAGLVGLLQGRAGALLAFSSHSSGSGSGSRGVAGGTAGGRGGAIRKPKPLCCSAGGSGPGSGNNQGLEGGSSGGSPVLAISSAGGLLGLGNVELWLDMRGLRVPCKDLLLHLYRDTRECFMEEGSDPADMPKDPISGLVYNHELPLELREDAVAVGLPLLCVSPSGQVFDESGRVLRGYAFQPSSADAGLECVSRENTLSGPDSVLMTLPVRSSQWDSTAVDMIGLAGAVAWGKGSRVFVSLRDRKQLNEAMKSLFSMKEGSVPLLGGQVSPTSPSAAEGGSVCLVLDVQANLWASAMQYIS